jgi:hypothetical protein
MHSNDFRSRISNYEKYRIDQEKLLLLESKTREIRKKLKIKSKQNNVNVNKKKKNFSNELMIEDEAEIFEKENKSKLIGSRTFQNFDFIDAKSYK